MIRSKEYYEAQIKKLEDKEGSKNTSNRRIINKLKRYLKRISNNEEC